MKIFVITTDIDETLIHNVSVEEGKYLKPQTALGDFTMRTEKILSLILQERPDKVIVEDVAFGKGLKDALISLMNSYGFTLKEDGTVRY